MTVNLLLEPFSYQFMTKAIFVSAAVGAVCAYLSAYLMLKGWSLIGDALSHSVLPGVAIAYNLAFPFAFGAFFSGFLAAIGILWVKSISHLKEDTIIGLVFTTFFALGLLINSLYPSPFSIQTIVFGNILGIADEDVWQILVIAAVSLLLMLLFRKDLLLVFFDEVHARTVGLSPVFYRAMFFCILSACVVAALQTVGAILVITMIVTPGATAYLLTDKFDRLLIISVVIGTLTSALGAYISFYLDGATGALIVILQTLCFIVAFLFAPKHGFFSNRRRLSRENTL